jgi:hypothetical protein
MPVPDREDPAPAPRDVPSPEHLEPPSPDSAPRHAPVALLTWSFILLILLIVVVLVIVKFTTPGPALDTPTHSAQPAPPALVRAVSTLPSSLFSTVGTPADGFLIPPVNASGQPPLVEQGLPTVLSVDAGFCDYCAAQRWSLVVALSRFGTFKNLGVTASSPTSAFPDIPTFSFQGTRYTSKYVAFTGLEEYSARADPSGGYATLASPTPAQSALLRRYDDPPYTVASASGSLPFLDIDNKVLWTGADGFSPGLLTGLSESAILTDLSDPTSPVSQAVIGLANEISAAICEVTGNRPAAVCVSTPQAALSGNRT